MDRVGMVEIAVVVLVAVVPFWLILRSAQGGYYPLPELEECREIEYQDDHYHYNPVGPVVNSKP